ncbi:hypothetical protein ARALYDRAFT_493002 [Arabidopsis lyrata subsp. lyrata]|uniref:Uncharacterized protein n=1 Tax=Arabidopsis lyrata subsp. lyrata TaxID=81972 RepID=D7MCQ6_ARALL|nr:hypothetical protein ARALYDRAFT_493002 [Arabidopsis lyrata subsp. lyrata]
MATLAPGHAVSYSWKRGGCNGVPLPYLIRPRRIFPPIDTFPFYNDYSSDDDDEAAGHSDDEYVVVDKAEAIMTNSKTEKPGAIQMMELSKDTVGDEESEAKDAGYSSDEWVVV